MRKTSVCITLALLLCTAALSLAAQAPAASAAPAGSASTAAPATTGTMAKPAKCKAAHGLVSDKEDAGKTFKVGLLGAPSPRSFTANDKTKYWAGKKKSDWAGFANGDTVSVTCTTKDGTDWAKTVKWAGAKKAPKAAAAPKTGR